MNSREDLEFPEDFFDPPKDRPEAWPDNPDLRRAVDWFKSFIPEAEWKVRRVKAATALYQCEIGTADSLGDGRAYNTRDTFGWYLFLAESYLDHIFNYDYYFGARVIPVFLSIGRNLDLIKGIQGVDNRVGRMVMRDHAQPNGSLFELLVAACYRRARAIVAFVEEQRGVTKTHDMDVTIEGIVWAVECKRMEVGEYGERERIRIGELWKDGSLQLSLIEKNALCHAQFRIELSLVPDSYLTEKVDLWLATAKQSFAWDDSIGCGTISDLDLAPLAHVLSTDHVLGSSTRILELLTGKYIRNANYQTVLRTKRAENPRYVDHCDRAIVLHWESVSDASIDGKARDIKKKLSEATLQLPDGRPCVVHIGFEAVEGDRVERVRYEKILATARQFDPERKKLEYVYCHYLVPESPPDQSWAFDETTQWCAVRPEHRRPLDNDFLVLPEGVETRAGAHWE